jgi:hypothetical protein
MSEKNIPEKAPKRNNRRLTIDDMQQLAVSRGGLCLSNEYAGTHEYLLWQCKFGHVWQSIPSNIKKGSWCPECSSGLGERICREYFQTIFKELFPKARPEWLVNSDGNRMELDGYCEKLKIAFEHQGAQHYSTNTKFIKSEKVLSKRQKDDIRKHELCLSHGIALIKIPEIMKFLQIKGIKSFIKRECLNANVLLPENFKSIRVNLKSVYSIPSNIEHLNELKAIAKKKGGIVLSNKYLDSHTKIKLKCGDGHVWWTTPNGIKVGHWCATCAGRGELTIQDMRETAAAKGGECLSKTYVNNRTKLKWKCSHGHIWDAPADHIRGGSWCPTCAGRPALRLQDMVKEAEKHNGKCLSPGYVNARTKLIWECHKGHSWKAIPDSIRRGSWCPVCSGRNRINVLNG